VRIFGDLDALVAESSNATCSLSLHHGSPFELEAELAKERDRRRQVLDDNADVIHPLKCHVAILADASGLGHMANMNFVVVGTVEQRAAGGRGGAGCVGP
jgi:hypothetical protein